MSTINNTIPSTNRGCCISTNKIIKSTNNSTSVTISNIRLTTICHRILAKRIIVSTSHDSCTSTKSSIHPTTINSRNSTYSRITCTTTDYCIITRSGIARSTNSYSTTGNDRALLTKGNYSASRCTVCCCLVADRGDALQIFVQLDFQFGCLSRAIRTFCCRS